MKKKIIYGCEGRGDADSPYLTRWTLLQTRWGNLYLHLFHRSDHDTLHDHPWSFWSLVLWRGYIEEYHTGQGSYEGEPAIARKRRWPLSLAYRDAHWTHRVELINDKPALTLIWRGPYVREWGFHTSGGWRHWRKYFEELGC